ncbi:Uncharacterized protein Fot_55346 [Forsythia ovata]|uniref:Uncharacterized protein n=1 Tax=Forsythia ovata TaxID=205694 RepID=A0ABD1P5A2_9LAMI
MVKIDRTTKVEVEFQLISSSNSNLQFAGIDLGSFYHNPFLYSYSNTWVGYKTTVQAFACFGAVFRSFAVRPLYLAKQLLVAGGISGVILSLLRLSHQFPGGDRQLQKQGLLWGFAYLNIFPFYQGFSSSSSILWHSSNFL